MDRGDSSVSVERLGAGEDMLICLATAWGEYFSNKLLDNQDCSQTTRITSVILTGWVIELCLCIAPCQ